MYDPQHTVNAAFLPSIARMLRSMVLVLLFTCIQSSVAQRTVEPLWISPAAGSSHMLSPDGRYIVSWRAQYVSIWETASARCLKTFYMPERYSPNGCCWNAQSTHVALWSLSGEVVVWTVNPPQQVLHCSVETQDAYANGVSFSEDGQFLVGLQRSGVVSVRSLQNGRIIDTTTAHAYSPDVPFELNSAGTKIYGSFADSVYSVIERGRAKVLKRFVHEGSTIARSFYFSKQRRVVTADVAGRVRVWGSEAYAFLDEYRDSTRQCGAAIMLPDADRCVVLMRSFVDSSKNILLMRSIGQHATLWQREVDVKFAWKLSMSASAEYLGLCSSNAYMILRCSDGAVVASPPASTFNYNPVLSFDSSASRIYLSTGLDLHIMDRVGLKVLGTIGGIRSVCREICLSPDERWVLSASMDSTIRLWDAATGTAGPLLDNVHAGMQSVCYSPKGNYILSTSSDAHFQYWDPHTFALLKNVDAGYIAGVTQKNFHPNGHKFLTRSDVDKAVHQWDLESATIDFILPNHTGGISTYCYAPSGRFIISSTSLAKLYTWDATTGVKLDEFKGYRGDLYECSMSNDEFWIVGPGTDTNVAVWLANGDLQYKLHAGAEPFTSALFMDDGNLVLGLGRHAKPALWSLTDGSLLRRYEIDSGQVYSFQGLYSDKQRKRFIAQNYGTLYLWDVQQRTPVARLVGMSGTGLESSLIDLCYNAAGTRVYAADWVNNLVYCWDISSVTAVEDTDTHSAAQVGNARRSLNARFDMEGDLTLSGPFGAQCEQIISIEAVDLLGRRRVLSWISSSRSAEIRIPSSECATLEHGFYGLVVYTQSGVCRTVILR